MLTVRILNVPALLLAALLAPVFAPASNAHADAASFWGESQLQTGIGGTYHFWSGTHAIVIPVTLVMDDNRYEFGVFRMADRQRFYDPYIHAQHQTADPYWGASLSRRWQPVLETVLRLRHLLQNAGKRSVRDPLELRLAAGSARGAQATPDLSGAGDPPLVQCRHQAPKPWSGFRDRNGGVHAVKPL
jgi:hypothetical protein